MNRPRRRAPVLVGPLAVALGLAVVGGCGVPAGDEATAARPPVPATAPSTTGGPAALSTVPGTGTGTTVGSTTPTTTGPQTSAPPTTASPASSATSTTATPPPAAAPPAGIAATPGRTRCGAVTHIGDSTSVGLVSPAYVPDPAQRLEAQYQRVGATEQHLEIDGARSIVETLPGQVNAHDTARRVRDGGFRGCWVLALGTTDTANVAVGSSVDRRGRIDRMMSVAGDDPVLWVTAKSLVQSGAWSDANMAAWNRELEAATSRYPNLHLYRWDEVAQPGWFSSDHIHYSGPGNVARARLIADALAAALPA